jgi:hypothetical protein
MLGLVIPAALRGPALGVVLAVMAIAGAWAWLRLVHDPAVRDALRAEIAAQTSAELAEHQRAAVVALADLEADIARRTAATTATRERIIRVPVATACAGSPAIAAALDGLRHGARGAGAPAGAADPAGLPARP